MPGCQSVQCPSRNRWVKCQQDFQRDRDFSHGVVHGITNPETVLRGHHVSSALRILLRYFLPTKDFEAPISQHRLSNFEVVLSDDDFKMKTSVDVKTFSVSRRLCFVVLYVNIVSGWNGDDAVNFLTIFTHLKIV